MFYHGISDDRIYRLGVVLLDLEDPTKIIYRSDEPIFEPATPYEVAGKIPNVVFSCGAVLIKNKIFLYYGAADQVIGVATIDKDKLFKNFQACS
jgi:beta-1,2-mannobiose phosphorylase / 1,2-beta-oligomannan phosphorylase